MKRIIAVLMAMVLLLGAFAGCSSEPAENPETENSEIALRIGNTEFTVKDVNFMYISTFNNIYTNLYYSYGENISNIVDMSKPLEEQMFDDTYTWDEYVLELSVATLTNYTGIYEKAMADGHEIPEEYAAELETLEKSYEETAEEAGMTVDEYITLMYGESVDFDTIYKMTEFEYYVATYAQEYQNSIEITDEDINAYYQENKNNLDTVSFRYFIIEYSDEEGALSEEEAKAQAELFAAAKSAEEFNSLAYEYAPEEMKQYYESEDGTLFPGGTPEAIGITALVDWLFDEGRTAGETFIHNESNFGAYFAVMFEERIYADYNFVDVRHILVMPEKDETGKASEEAWNSAKEKADEIYAEYLAGEKTEESFSALAVENSEDGNAASGGIYENVYKGQMVAPFENWCFDETRKPGDTGIVETSFGYHIMYFVGEGDNNLVSLVQPILEEETMAAWVAENGANLTVERLEAFETAGKVIDDIIAAAEEKAAQEQAEASAEEETGNVTNEEVVSGENK